MAECIVKCLDNPDDVDKINWKCVECKTDLKQACEDSRKEKQDIADAKLAEAKVLKKGELTEEQIADRRAMAEDN